MRLESLAQLGGFVRAKVQYVPAGMSCLSVRAKWEAPVYSSQRPHLPLPLADRSHEFLH